MTIQASRNVRTARALVMLLMGSSAVTLTGCGGTMQAYDGPKLELSEVAVIKAFEPLTLAGHMAKGTHPLSISQIDGRNMGFSDKCTVLPGTHKVSVVMSMGIYGSVEKDIEFRAQAGHVYTVYGTRFGGGSVWVVDDETGEVVAK